MDESPIGRTPRSVPATYVGIMDAIRTLFAAVPDARALGYGRSRFSFNVKGGRCERCEGQGRLRVTMALLPDTYVPCESCRGRRYNADTQAVLFKGKSVAEVLEMTIDEARLHLSTVGAIRRPLDFLSGIGLGYLALGQPSPTLSGGEAQRIKLAAELTSPGFGPSLFVLDEPTTGLHMADVAKLVTALQSLVDRGDTVIVIEHNLDLIAAADCVIDLGPEGGEKGGRVVAWGTPEQVARVEGLPTAPYLRGLRRPSPDAGAPATAERPRLSGRSRAAPGGGRRQEGWSRRSRSGIGLALRSRRGARATRGVEADAARTRPLATVRGGTRPARLERRPPVPLRPHDLCPRAARTTAAGSRVPAGRVEAIGTTSSSGRPVKRTVLPIATSSRRAEPARFGAPGTATRPAGDSSTSCPPSV